MGRTEVKVVGVKVRDVGKGQVAASRVPVAAEQVEVLLRPNLLRAQRHCTARVGEDVNEHNIR